MTGSAAAEQTFAPPAGTRLYTVSLLVDDLAAFERVVAATGAERDAPEFDMRTGERRPPSAHYRDAGAYVSIALASESQLRVLRSSGGWDA